MAESANTRPSLLARIRDARDGPAWTQFVEIYAPLVYAFGRKQGLQDADAADLTQDVLRAVARAMADRAYDAGRGSFRGWLFTVARNTLRNFLAARKRHPRGSGDSGVQNRLEEQPAPQTEAVQWDQEYEQRLFAWASRQVQAECEESTWQAFWQTAVDGKSARDTAESLGMSVGAVYIARSRVLARLKEQIQLLEPE